VRLQIGHGGATYVCYLFRFLPIRIRIIFQLWLLYLRPPQTVIDVAKDPLHAVLVLSLEL